MNLTDISEFEKTVTKHRQRYPLMKPDDYIKLAYQSEFGPKHFAEDESKIIQYLSAEWKAAPAADSPPEAIGSSLCRFHLSGSGYCEEAVKLLAKLFLMTAEQSGGELKSFEQKLLFLETLEIDGMAKRLKEYRAEGCPSVHHSDDFREAYAPHYRLLRKEYAGYFPALLKIAKLSAYQRPVIIAIDGRCGSGKTRFAKLISELFFCNVFHTDDYYLPLSERQSDWKETTGGNMDFVRLLSEIIIPAKNGEKLIYKPYSCRKKGYGEISTIEPKQLSIIEGSYSQNPLLAENYDLKIFLDCEKEIQSARLKKREGEHFRDFEEIWIPLEENHIRMYGIERKADIVIDTSYLF